MKRKIKPGIFEVGARHWDRRLFDELIPLPEGTSYNAYFIQGSEKNALIDTVDPDTEAKLIQHLDELEVSKIDYIISNHAEQDHSGTIPTILNKFPESKVVTNEKNKKFLMDLLHIPEDKFIGIKDRETISLGNKTFEFILTPWVHWPETMITYLKEDKILFSCDLFGSHLAASYTFAEDKTLVYESAKRYFAEIMMPFRRNIINHMKKIAELDIDIIGPSHGPIYNEPEFIINAYQDWISDNVKNEVLLPYVSMHGSTKTMVDYFTNELAAKNIHVKPFNLTVTDIGELAINLVDAATIIIATPTVLTGPHPTVVNTTYLVNALRPKTRYLSVIGSYGWSCKTVDVLKDMLGNMKSEFLDPVYITGHPQEDDYKSLSRLAEDIHKKHKELNIL